MVFLTTTSFCKSEWLLFPLFFVILFPVALSPTILNDDWTVGKGVVVRLSRIDISAQMEASLQRGRESMTEAQTAAFTRSSAKECLACGHMVAFHRWNRGCLHATPSRERSQECGCQFGADFGSVE